MTAAKMKIKKGDQVVVLTGKDKGKTGEVLKAMPTESRVIVAGVNVMKKHTKPTQFAAGGIEDKEVSIHISNVALVGKDGKATRVGFKTDSEGKKTRIARKSGDAL